jgi:hypothetical protein
MEPNTEFPPSDPLEPAAVEDAADPPSPPAPIVTVYSPGEVEIGKDVAVLYAPAPPPPLPMPYPLAPPPPPPMTRYSTSAGYVPSSLTSKVPDDVKMCAL